MSIVMHFFSACLWVCAIFMSVAVGMLLEEGEDKIAERGIGVVFCFAVCAFILQVVA